MPFASRLLFLVRITQAVLSFAETYLLISTFRNHVQSNPEDGAHYALFGTGLIVSISSIAITIFDIQKIFTRRTRRRNYGSLGSVDADAQSPSPRFRMIYEQIMLGMWFVSAVLMLVSLNVEIGSMAWVAYGQILLFATSACLVERDVHRIALRGAPIVKARSVSAGDVIFPGDMEKV